MTWDILKLNFVTFYPNYINLPDCPITAFIISFNNCIHSFYPSLDTVEMVVQNILIVLVFFTAHASGVTHIVGDSIWSVPPTKTFYEDWASTRDFHVDDELCMFTTHLYINVACLHKFHIWLHKEINVPSLRNTIQFV